MADVLHVTLTLVLTAILACQARTFAILLRSYRQQTGRRHLRIAELVWMAIPLAVVILLAGRSWTVVLDQGTTIAGAGYLN